MTTYKITRFYRDERRARTIKRGLTLEEAQAWCRDPGTRGDNWFDGYDAEHTAGPIDGETTGPIDGETTGPIDGEARRGGTS